MRIPTPTLVLFLLLAIAPSAYAQQVASNADVHDFGGSRLQWPALLEIESVSLDLALQALHRASGVNLLYSPSQLPRIAVNCACRDRTIEQALERLLEGTRLTFQEVEEEVVIVPARVESPYRQSVFVSATSLAASPLRAVRHMLPFSRQRQDSVVAGVVVDAATGVAIEGAQIVIDGTRLSGVTSADGRFRIGGLGGEEVRLRIAMIGYRTMTQAVRAGQEDIRVEMEQTAVALDELVVTGSVHPTAVRAVPTPITIITADDIQQKGVQRIDQLFRGDIPGAIALDGGPYGFVSQTLVRGTSSVGGAKYLKTYVDGVEIASPFYLSGLDPSSIERIEIIRGPQGSTVYGAEALSGVMQIFTKKGSARTSPQIELTSMVGAQETGYASSDRVVSHDHRVSVMGGAEGFSYHLGGAYRYIGEWIPEFHNKTGSLSGGMQGSHGPLTMAVSARYTQPEIGLPVLPIFQDYPSAFPVPYNRVSRFPTTTVGARLGYQPVPWWTHNATVGQDAIRTDQHNTAPASSDTLYSVAVDRLAKTTIAYHSTIEPTLRGAIQGTLTLGADHWIYDYSSVVLRSPTLQPTTTSPTLQSGSRVHYSNTGYYAQAQIGWSEAIFVTAGVRADDNELFGSEYGVAWSPRLGLTYATTRGSLGFKVRGSYGKAIKPPLTFHVMGSTQSNAIPNPTIGPEAQQGVDAGIELYFGESAQLEATYYDQTAGDLIDFVTIDHSTTPVTRQFQNIGRLKNRGVEVAGTVRPLPGVSVRATYALVNSEVLELSPDYAGDLRSGDEPLGVPKHSGGATLTYDGRYGNVSLSGTYVGSQTETDYVAYYGWSLGGEPYRGSGRDYWMSIPSFVKFGLRASRDLTPRITALLNVDNLANSQRAETYNIYPVSGRLILVGLRVR